MDITCAICLESFTPNCEVSSTPCGHLFHSACLCKSVTSSQNTCPTCRQPCSQNIRRVYLQGANSPATPQTPDTPGSPRDIDLDDDECFAVPWPESEYPASTAGGSNLLAQQSAHTVPQTGAQPGAQQVADQRRAENTSQQNVQHLRVQTSSWIREMILSQSALELTAWQTSQQIAQQIAQQTAQQTTLQTAQQTALTTALTTVQQTAQPDLQQRPAVICSATGHNLNQSALDLITAQQIDQRRLRQTVQQTNQQPHIPQLGPGVIMLDMEYHFVGANGVIDKKASIDLIDETRS